jgi:hypothetical protein
MQGGETIAEQFAAARAQLDAACSLLLAPTPAAVDQSAALLESAGRRLLDCRDGLSEQHGDAEVLVQAWSVRRSFQRAARLLENAARFHDNWIGVRGAMTGGYTSRGEPAPVRHPGRLCLEA